ncbi:MAG: exodeoxyribonuclease VII small subunit [Eubacteriales bacterium]
MGTKKMEKITIEVIFEQIEEVIDQLEDSEVTLEDSFKSYQEGMKLLKQCNDKIDRIEKEMIVLSQVGEDNE